MQTLTKLTAEQEAMLPVAREEWISHGLSTAPADRQSAETGVRLAYEAAGMVAPRLMIWLRSPIEGAVGAAMISQVGAQVRDQVRDQVWAQVRDQVWAQVWDQVGDQVWDQVWDQVGAQVGDQVWDQVRDQVRDQVGAQVNRCGYGQHDANWIGFYETFGRFGIDVSRLAGLSQITRSAGWWWPFQGACILTERPTRLERDEQGRLHSETGMAIEYPDGWGIYAVHGVRCPERVILRPETLTAAEVLSESNSELRRIMVDRFGMERLIRETNARKLDCDEHGTLWQVPLPGDESIVAVEVVNSTSEPDGSYRRYMLRVPPDIRKARAAVAWTFGVSAEEYLPLAQS